MSATPAMQSGFDDVTLLKLARELSMDIRPLDEILKDLGVSESRWEEIRTNPTFQGYLRNMIEEWNSALNTAERVRLKSLAFVEVALPEFFARAHDSKESLMHKVEVLKTVAKFAGVGVSTDGGATGDRMVVTINLGSDHQVRFEKDVTPKVIEGDML